MAGNVYTVVLYERQWKVRFAGKHSGPYATQQEAISTAIDAAHKASKANQGGAVVRVQDTNNQFRTAWTYGKDPYPP